MSKMIDLTGQTFGYWTVLQRVENSKDGRAQWLCRCKCGNQKIISGTVLRNGHSKSCGCYKKQNPGRLKDITNQRFGHLIALERMPIGFNNSYTGPRFWKCQCDCGNITYANTHHLLAGEIQSCGCTKKSRGAEKIANILLNNNIKFETEKTFSSCFFPDTKYLAKFDFFVDNKYIIEFDGQQHFKFIALWHKTLENFKKMQEKDQFKNNWCKKNNIPIIRIPYTHEQEITLKDLLLETSNFIL